MRKPLLYLSIFWRWFNTAEGIVRARLIYDIFTLIFWFLYYSVKTKYIYRLTCPTVWTKEYCDAYVSSQTFWINLPFFAALFIDLGVFILVHKNISKLSTLQWFRQIMIGHVLLMLFWIISSASTALWGLFPFLLIGLAFDIFVLLRIRKLTREYEQISQLSYVL